MGRARLALCISPWRRQLLLLFGKLSVGFDHSLDSRDTQQQRLESSGGKDGLTFVPVGCSLDSALSLCRLLCHSACWRWWFPRLRATAGLASSHPTPRAPCSPLSSSSQILRGLALGARVTQILSQAALGASGSSESDAGTLQPHRLGRVATDYGGGAGEVQVHFLLHPSNAEDSLSHCPSSDCAPVKQTGRNSPNSVSASFLLDTSWKPALNVLHLSAGVMALEFGRFKIWIFALSQNKPVAQLVKNPPAMQETWVRSLGWEDPLEKGKATHSSILAWRIPWTV